MCVLLYRERLGGGETPVGIAQELCAAVDVLRGEEGSDGQEFVSCVGGRARSVATS